MNARKSPDTPWFILILGAGVGMALVLYMVGARVIQRDRDHQLENERERQALVADLVGQQVESTQDMLKVELALVDKKLSPRLREHGPQQPDWRWLSRELRELTGITSHLRALSVVDSKGQVLASSHPIGGNLNEHLSAFQRPLTPQPQWGQLAQRPAWLAPTVHTADAPLLLLGRELTPVAEQPLHLLVLVDATELVRWDAALWRDLPGFAWVGDGEGRVWVVSPGAASANGAPLTGQRLPVQRETQPGALASHDDAHWPEHGGAVRVEYRRLPDTGVLVGVVSRNQDVMRRLASRPTGTEGWFELMAVLVLATSAVLALVSFRHQRSVALLRASEAALQASNAAKSAFVANMSHELRTPIGAILGLSDLLLAQAPTPALREGLDAIQTSGRGLLRLVDRVLDHARLQTGLLMLAQERWDLQRVCRQLEGDYHARAQAAGLSFAWDTAAQVPTLVRGDAERWKQVMDALLDNAVRLTPAGGRVTVQMGLLAFHRGVYTLQVVVRDTGPGMAPELAQAVFDGFVQADGSAQRRHAGVGLSLALARQLARCMGGDLRVVPHDGPGAWFDFVCNLGAYAATPAEAPPVPDAPPATPQGAPVDDTPPVRVLSVEDTEVNQKIICLLLQRLGCQVQAAANGVEAVALCAQGAFDLVLMDLQMPEMDGLEACRHIRAAEAAGQRPAVPMVAVTAHGDLADKAACLAAGMNGFMNKPVSAAGLTGVLEAHTRWRAPSAGA